MEDRYDPKRSEMWAQAVLGNIARIYLPGAAGRVLATLPAEPEGQWLFLLMDESSDRLVTYNSLKVRVGWVLMK